MHFENKLIKSFKKLETYPCPKVINKKETTNKQIGSFDEKHTWKVQKKNK